MVERKRGGDRYDSDEGYDSKRGRRSGSIIKLLCPYYNAGAVIGKGGDRIKEVKDRTGASIEISRHDARFPGTEERVITIQGERDELQEACRLINERMKDDSPPASSRTYDDDINERRRKTSKLLVCDSSMAMIIGRGGDNIRDLKRDHAVQINTSKRNETPRSLDERIISIEGEDRDVNRCIDDIIAQIYDDERSRMRFYVDYAEFNGRSGGRRTHHDRRDRDRYDRRSRSRDRRHHRSRSHSRDHHGRRDEYRRRTRSRSTKSRSRSPRSRSRSPKSKSRSPKSGSPKSRSPKSRSPKAHSPKSGSPKARSRSPNAQSPKSRSSKSRSPKARSPKSRSRSRS